MKFILLYMGSVFASYGIDYASGLKLYKVAADNGYKFNLDVVIKDKEDTNEQEKEAGRFSSAKIRQIFSLIPVANIIIIF